jgi:hypothetical protein
MKLGLLLEGAHAHQTLAETTLEKLKGHVAELGGIAREEIRATLLEELHALGEDSRRAAQTLRQLRHAANLRVSLWSLGMALLSCAVPLGIAWWVLPSHSEVARLTERRDALEGSIARLTQMGGRTELRRCGTAQRLCVRVDRRAPAYGEDADYFVVKGY